MIARSRFVLIALILAVIAPPRVQAQQKPLALLSISSIDSLLGNLEYLTDAAGAADLGQFAKMMANPYLEGLDRTKPIGFVVSTDGQQFVPLGFIPVHDLDKTLSTLEEQIGAPRDAGNGIKEIVGPQSVFIKEQNGWAFVGQTVESLATLPQDPVKALRSLPQDYDLAIRGHVQNVPKPYLQMAVTTLQEGIKQGLQQLPDEDRAAQEELMNIQMQQLETFITESDEITLGWKTDPTAQRTYLDMTFTAVPGGKLAEQMAGMADAKSDYSGFLIPGAAMTMNVSSKIPPEQAATSVQAIENLKGTVLRELEEDGDLESPEARKTAKELVNAVMDILIATIKTGTMDGGASVVLKPQAMTVLAGFHVADGKEVEKILKQLQEMANNEPGFPGIKFNADGQAGVTFHTLKMPVPEEEDARKVLGETMEVAVGIGQQSVYFGFGAECLAKLKSIIASQPKQKQVPPFQMTLSLSRVMEFVASIEDNPLVGAVNDALTQAGDKDHVKIRGIPVPNGFTYRIELEEGVLRAVGEAVKMSNAGGF